MKTGEYILCEAWTSFIRSYAASPKRGGKEGGGEGETYIEPSSPFLKLADAAALLEASLIKRITPSRLSSPTTIPCVYAEQSY